MAWFLLGPGSSARVSSLSLEKFCLGKLVAQYGVSATRTVEAMWMFPGDCSISYWSWPRVGG